MIARVMAMRLVLVGAVAALAFFAFASTASTPTAEATATQLDCQFVPPLQDIIQDALEGPASGTVTCTFTIRGEEHTLIVGFTLDLTAFPPISIDGCTLDGEPIHVGPCP